MDIRELLNASDNPIQTADQSTSRAAATTTNPWTYPLDQVSPPHRDGQYAYPIYPSSTIMPQNPDTRYARTEHPYPNQTGEVYNAPPIEYTYIPTKKERAAQRAAKAAERKARLEAEKETRAQTLAHKQQILSAFFNEYFQRNTEGNNTSVKTLHQEYLIHYGEENLPTYRTMEQLVADERALRTRERRLTGSVAAHPRRGKYPTLN
jgi:hypothetical protein